jgi:hypothetical protein
LPLTFSAFDARRAVGLNAESAYCEVCKRAERSTSKARARKSAQTTAILAERLIARAALQFESILNRLRNGCLKFGVYWELNAGTETCHEPASCWESSAMIATIVFSLVLGFVLGRRFKFLVLIPAVLLVEGVIIGLGIARDYDAWIVALAVFIAAFALQGSYLVGAHQRTKQAGPDSIHADAVLRPSFEDTRNTPTTELS